MNSTIVAVVVTAGNLLFCSMLGYALAMLDFPANVLFALVMGTLLIPGVVTFVPLFVLVANVGLVDTLPGLILPFLVTPFGVFLMRQYIKGLPRPARRRTGRRSRRAEDLRAHHPAAVRACPGDPGHPHLPRQLEQLPLAPGRRADRGHLHAARRARALLQGPERHQLRLLLAGATVVVMPILLVFLAFQRRFIEGIATTGIK